jgi:hypothetical protein
MALISYFLRIATPIFSTNAGDVHPTFRRPKDSAPLGFLDADRMKDVLKAMDTMITLSALSG